MKERTLAARLLESDFLLSDFAAIDFPKLVACLEQQEQPHLLKEAEGERQLDLANRTLRGEVAADITVCEWILGTRWHYLWLLCMNGEHQFAWESEQVFQFDSLEINPEHWTARDTRDELDKYIGIPCVNPLAATIRYPDDKHYRIAFASSNTPTAPPSAYPYTMPSFNTPSAWFLGTHTDAWRQWMNAVKDPPIIFVGYDLPPEPPASEQTKTFFQMMAAQQIINNETNTITT